MFKTNNIEKKKNEDLSYTQTVTSTDRMRHDRLRIVGKLVCPSRSGSE